MMAVEVLVLIISSTHVMSCSYTWHCFYLLSWLCA